MEIITIGKHTLLCTLNTQISPKGRNFRCSGISEDSKGWIHTFKFLDKQGGFISFLIGFNGKFKEIINE
tara:strand:- start:364 stop:570 length:207 start_codon:yes stop_codon:yes gene_type:complete